MKSALLRSLNFATFLALAPLASALSAGTAVAADIHLGDKAVYTVTLFGPNGRPVYTDAQSSMEVVGYDPKFDNYLVKHTFQIRNKAATPSTSDTIPRGDEQKEEILWKQCDSRSNVNLRMENLQLPLGLFRTCKATVSPVDAKHIARSETWRAQVPFGIVKMISYQDDGSMMDETLTAYTFGTKKP